MDCSPPGSSIHGILQARVQEWVAISFSSGAQSQIYFTHCYWRRHQNLMKQRPQNELFYLLPWCWGETSYSALWANPFLLCLKKKKSKQKNKRKENYCGVVNQIICRMSLRVDRSWWKLVWSEFSTIHIGIYMEYSKTNMSRWNRSIKYFYLYPKRSTVLYLQNCLSWFE